MAIDIGPVAIDRDIRLISSLTGINLENPANATGTIDTMEFWWEDVDGTGVKAGTFFGSSTDYTSRDVEIIGTVTADSKQTFSGLDCDVETGDFIGTYHPSGGGIERSSTGFLGVYFKSGDQFGAGLQTYSLLAGDATSAYGTGTEAPSGWAGEYCGVAVEEFDGVTPEEIDGV